MERRRIDIGGGVELDAVVAGTGPVTVVFENGLATALEEWDVVAAALLGGRGRCATTGAARHPPVPCRYERRPIWPPISARCWRRSA
jgi:hypothetical protein